MELEVTIYNPRRELAAEYNRADTLILDFQPLELWENEFLLFKPPNLWYFIIAAKAN